MTVIEATPNRITQVKTAGIDGYSAIQVTKGGIKSSRVNKPRAGHFAKANVEAGRKLWEFRVGDETELNVGDSLTVEGLKQERVDVSGHLKGKGFAGVIKRHNFKMQDATHGNSISPSTRIDWSMPDPG